MGGFLRAWTTVVTADTGDSLPTGWELRDPTTIFPSQISTGHRLFVIG
jgi:hypothetical protein